MELYMIHLNLDMLIHCLYIFFLITFESKLHLV